MKIKLTQEQIDEIQISGERDIYYSDHLTGIRDDGGGERLHMIVKKVSMTTFDKLPKRKQNPMWYGENEPIIHYKIELVK